VYNHTKHIETFGVNIPVQLFVKYAEDGNEALKRFCDKVMTGTNALMAEQWHLPNLGIRKVIDEVIHSSFDGGLQKLFLLSKSIELLVLQAQQLGSPKDMHKRVIRTKADQNKIAEARYIIDTRYQSPPTLSALAKEIGMNECKLKQGFKEVFDTTVFGYLSYLRLKLARRMLQDTQQTAKEIAYELGYSSPQHFNNAFKKEFGVTPAFVRQTP
jgi:AraC-like DNA-binding protein